MAELKRVTFEVAKALKDAGYPQLKADWSYGSKSGELVHFVDDADYVIPAPTYLAVWLWLWREKGIAINLQVLSYPCIGWAFSIECINTSHLRPTVYDNQEDAVVAAIEYLVENNLIK